MSGRWERTQDTSRLFSVNPPPPAQAAQAEASLGTKVQQWLSGPVGQVCAVTALGVACYIVGGQGGSKTRRNHKSVRKSRRSKRGGAA